MNLNQIKFQNKYAAESKVNYDAVSPVKLPNSKQKFILNSALSKKSYEKE